MRKSLLIIALLSTPFLCLSCKNTNNIMFSPFVPDITFSKVYSDYEPCGLRGVVVESDGYCVYGTAFESFNNRPVIIKTDSYGNKIWAKKLDFAYESYITSGAKGDNGYYYFSGLQYSTPDGELTHSVNSAARVERNAMLPSGSQQAL